MQHFDPTDDAFISSLSDSERDLLRKFPKIAEGLPDDPSNLVMGQWEETTTPLAKAVVMVFASEYVKQGITSAETMFGKAIKRSDIDSIIKKQERAIAADLGDFSAKEITRHIADSVGKAIEAATDRMDDSNVSGSRRRVKNMDEHRFAVMGLSRKKWLVAAQGSQVAEDDRATNGSDLNPRDTLLLNSSRTPTGGGGGKQPARRSRYRSKQTGHFCPPQYSGGRNEPEQTAAGA